MRPYIEFVQSQAIPWSAAPPELGGASIDWKVLSRDPSNGAVTALIRIRNGRSAELAAALTSSAELFVLKGALAWAEIELGTHGYAWLPARSALARLRSMPFDGHEQDAIVLAAFDGGIGAAEPSKHVDAPIGPIDTVALPWDDAGMDPNINHLNAARKNLRLAPDGQCRTYLLGGMPQGYPYPGSRLERHPHVEEFFMISGDMSCHVGTMRTGAYFHRPPDIDHGRDCTRTGYLLFCRTPGTNRTISAWSNESYPVSWHPSHRPVLPSELESAGAPQPDPIEY